LFPESDQTINSKATCRRVLTLRISLKNSANESPLGANLWQQFQILPVLGAVFPHFCPDKCEIWHGERRYAFPRQISRYVSPLRGEKPIFGPLSKNNTGMAALRAGLPVKNTKN